MAARIKTIGKAQKPQGNCQKCGVAINVGDPYRYFKVGFRSRTKNVRCMKAECSPRRSEMTASMLSEAYAAQESASDNLMTWADGMTWEQADEAWGDLEAILQEAAEGARNVASQYEDSISNAPMLEDQLRETIDLLEQYADELESPSDLEEFSAEDAEDGDENCEHCGGDGKCDIGDNEEAGDDEPCSDCGATRNSPECTNCDGTGTVEGEQEDADSNNADSFADWVQAQRDAAQELLDSLEA